MTDGHPLWLLALSSLCALAAYAGSLDMPEILRERRKRPPRCSFCRDRATHRYTRDVRHRNEWGSWLERETVRACDLHWADAQRSNEVINSEEVSA